MPPSDDSINSTSGDELMGCPDGSSGDFIDSSFVSSGGLVGSSWESLLRSGWTCGTSTDGMSLDGMSSDGMLSDGMSSDGAKNIFSVVGK